MVDAPQARVWELLSNTAEQPNWRLGLGDITRGGWDRTVGCWTEHWSGTKLAICREEEQPMDRIVLRTAKWERRIRGRWTYTLEAESASSTRVTLTEDVVVTSPLRRLLRHIGSAEDGRMRDLMRDLQAEGPRQR